MLAEGGNVGIGTTTPTHKLAVNGSIRAKEVIVDTGWADYVLDENYRLAPLSEVEQHIRDRKHLPGIPTAAEIAERGVSLGDMQVIDVPAEFGTFTSLSGAAQVEAKPREVVF